MYEGKGAKIQTLYAFDDNHQQKQRNRYKISEPNS